MERELTEVYCGNGKGKTALAIGQSLREATQGKSVIVIQFLKGRERKSLDFLQELMNLGDQLKAKLGDGVILLASENGGKVSLLAMVTDDAMKKGAHAGKLIKEVAAVVGGGGGGRPNMAQAGGKNPEKIDEAVAKAAEVLEGQIA